MNSSPEVLTIKAIVGDAMVSPSNALAQIDRIRLRDVDFTEPPARALFAGVAASLRQGRAPEAVSLMATLGKSVPRELVMDVLTNFETGVSAVRLEELREAGRRRSLATVLRGLAAKVEAMKYAHGYEETRRAIEALDSPEAEMRTLDTEVFGLIDEVEAVAAGRSPPTLTTGIEALDLAIGGLQPTLTILGAEPGAGKSALMNRIIRNVAERGTKVGVFSLEDQSRWMVRRMVAETSSVPVFVLQNKRLVGDQLRRFGEATEEVHKAASHVVVEDRKGLTVKDIVAGARIMIARYGVKVIFVDHLGEIRLERSDRHDRDVGEALRELRGIADVHKVPIVVLCHVKRRDGVGDEPRLTDFAFSADVERTARVALALVKPAENRQGVHVLKQTSGPSGIAVWLVFNASAAMSTNFEAPGGQS